MRSVVPSRLAEPVPGPEHLLVKLRKADGSEIWLRVPEEHLQRVLDLACGEFGDSSIQLGGPRLVKAPA